jgi:hypothetical protein
MKNLSQEQQDALLQMSIYAYVRPKLILEKINDILSRNHLEHIPWAYEISIDEAKQLFPEMEIYRDYENGAQGLVLNISEIEEEPEMSYCIEEITLRTWVPF